jgi:predicted MFS family arabinose efflux permease
VARTFFNVYLDSGLHVTTAQIGALTAVGQLLSVPAVMAAPLLAQRWGTGPTYALSSLGIALGLLPLALIRHWGAAGIGHASVMALALVSNPALTVFHQEIVAPGWRAAIAGAIAMAMGLGWSATALGGGHLITALGYRCLFLMGAGLTVAGVLLFWAYFRVPRGELARRSTPG